MFAFFMVLDEPALFLPSPPLHLVLVPSFSGVSGKVSSGEVAFLGEMLSDEEIEYEGRSCLGAMT